MRQLSSILKGCVLHIPLDPDGYNPTTRRFTDKSAFGNHGTSANPAIFVNDRVGQANKSMLFNGTSDHIPCGDLGFADNTFTMCAWWNQTASNSTVAPPVSTLKYNHPATGASFAPCNNTIIRVCCGRPSSGYQNYTITQPYSFGVWYHTMLTYDGTLLKTYFNNQEINSFVANIPTSVNTWIGRWTTYVSHHFDGELADVWIHNRALTESERTFLYESYNPSVII